MRPTRRREGVGVRSSGNGCIEGAGLQGWGAQGWAGTRTSPGPRTTSWMQTASTALTHRVCTIIRLATLRSAPRVPLCAPWSNLHSCTTRLFIPLNIFRPRQCILTAWWYFRFVSSKIFFYPFLTFFELNLKLWTSVKFVYMAFDINTVRRFRNLLWYFFRSKLFVFLSSRSD